VKVYRFARGRYALRQPVEDLCTLSHAVVDLRREKPTAKVFLHRIIREFKIRFYQQRTIKPFEIPVSQHNGRVHGSFWGPQRIGPGLRFPEGVERAMMADPFEQRDRWLRESRRQREAFGPRADRLPACRIRCQRQTIRARYFPFPPLQ
jgi:hypothetical protein